MSLGSGASLDRPSGRAPDFPLTAVLSAVLYSPSTEPAFRCRDAEMFSHAPPSNETCDRKLEVFKWILVPKI